MDDYAAPGTGTHSERVTQLVTNITTAHRLTIDRKVAEVSFAGDRMLTVQRPTEVEHILERSNVCRAVSSLRLALALVKQSDASKVLSSDR